MKEGMFRKGLVLAIVVLFIAINISPALATNIKSITETKIVNESNNNDKIEYVIQIVRTNKIIEHKVYLTQQQANELENLIDNVRSDLNNSKSIEETTEICNAAIDSFNNFGLFPENITEDEIKQLVSGKTQHLNSIKFRNKMDDGFENRLCFVAGDTSETLFLGPILLLTALIFIPTIAIGLLHDYLYYTYNLSNFKLLNLGYYIILFLIAFPLYFLLPISIASIYSLLPVAIGSIVELGRTVTAPNSKPHWYYPAEGWISTLGTNGRKDYSGSFYGQINTLGPAIDTYYTGISGFTGIHILREKASKVFYLGFALNVHIDPKPWEK
jgi:hypothetical protein